MRSLIRIVIGVSLVFGTLVIGLHVWAKNERGQEEKALGTRQKNVLLSSRSFPPNGDMPVDCSCNGRETSPALAWETSQSAVQSYAILATDYDVPSPSFSLLNLSHWVIYNLPASVRGLPEGVTTEQMRMLGGRTGKNSKGDLAFIGPCPPLGRHAYVFRIYALNQLLRFSDPPDKEMVLKAMKGHILGYGELTGYSQ